MDLTKKENREKFLNDCEISLIGDLRNNGVLLAGDTICDIRESLIEIGIINDEAGKNGFAWGSEVKIYRNNNEFFGETNKPYTMSYSSGGSADLIDDTIARKRNQNIGRISEQWETCCSVFAKYWQRIDVFMNTPVISEKPDNK